MNMEDHRLEEAFSSISISDIMTIRNCLKKLTICKEHEAKNKLLATVPCARRILSTFVNEAIGYSRMNIIFPAFFDELCDFINQDSGVVTFLDFNAHVVTERISKLQSLPYPAEGVTIYNPHIGLTAEGYFPRLSAVSAIIAFYDKWIELINTFLSFYSDYD